MDIDTSEYINRLAPTKGEVFVTSRETKAITIVALVKGEERYVFVYDDANRAETLRTLGRFASKPDLSFTWYDAAIVSQRIRQEEGCKSGDYSNMSYSEMKRKRFELDDCLD